MSATVTFTEQLTVHSCNTCNMNYAAPEDFFQRRREDHVTFYCPSGHHNYYPQKSDLEKAKERAERLAQQLASREDDLRAERMSHDSTRGSLIATKGALTKTRNRAEKGLCLHCHRSFVDVARHMQSQHKEELAS